MVNFQVFMSFLYVFALQIILNLLALPVNNLIEKYPVHKVDSSLSFDIPSRNAFEKSKFEPRIMSLISELSNIDRELNLVFLKQVEVIHL